MPVQPVQQVDPLAEKKYKENFYVSVSMPPADAQSVPLAYILIIPPYSLHRCMQYW